MVTILLLGLGIALTAGGIYMLVTHHQMAGWPTTPGEVIERSLENVGPKSESLRERYKARVRYRFTVNGQTYTGDRIQPADVVGTKADTQKLLDQLSDQVTVHYNPSNPGEAYLMPLSVWWAWLALAAGLVLLLVAAGKLLLAE